MKICDVCGREVDEFKPVPRKYLEDKIKHVCIECAIDIILEIQNEIDIFNVETKQKIKQFIVGKNGMQ